MNKLIKYTPPLKHVSIFDENQSPFLSFNRLFESFFDGLKQNNDSFKETENEYLMEIELPRFKKDEVTVEIKNDNLVISAKAKRENFESQFYQEIFVGSNVKTDKINAKLEYGVLVIKVPKKEKIKGQIIDVE